VSRDVIFEEEIVFQKSRESHIKIDSETIPSPPSTIQREIVSDPVDPVALVDIPRDIGVVHKRPS
jgi:hypothetical protein